MPVAVSEIMSPIEATVGADVATKRGSRFFAEVKVGFADSPDLRVLAGLNFGSR